MKALFKKFLALFLVCVLGFVLVSENGMETMTVSKNSKGKDYIKWVDFNVTYEALSSAMNKDIETFEQDVHISWIDILSYLSCIYGGQFSSFKQSDIDRFQEEIESGKSVDDITKDLKYYNYYYKAYTAVLGNMLGLDSSGNYGLIAYSPVKEGYWYNDCDDFGNGRDYGFARKHLGHDMFCSTGTPVIAVEGGRVEALGWNQYGGWRIGIRSDDNFRYFYYAHLRKDSPYVKGLKIGQHVNAGQVIGYTGQSGYSIKENVNNINVPHLHFGIQLIFDESQKECNSEIWIDAYPIIRLLSRHRSKGAPSNAVVTSKVRRDSVDVPILMYHGLTKNPAYVNNYVIPVSTFESDLKYLQRNGYNSIFMSDLIDYVTGKLDSLPDKPVVISFDDGYCNNYNFASPLLKKYRQKAVISVIGAACQEASEATYRSENFCNVTWNQIGQMDRSGLWEIQNHTYDLHHLDRGRKGAGKKSGESTESYHRLLKSDLISLQKKLKKITGKYPTTFAWPFGAFDPASDRILRDMGFQASFSCSAGINTIKKGDSDGLFLLRRNLRTPNASISKLLQD